MDSPTPRLPLASRTVAQDALLDHLRERSVAVDVRASLAIAGLDAEARARPRADGGWGVGQILEHLVIAADDYLGALDRRLARGGEAAPPGATWRASVMGRLLLRSLDETARRRLPAPPRWRTGQRLPAENALARFLASQDRLRVTIERARGVHLQRLRLASPVMPLLRMNAGDALAVMVVHAERHMAQLERAAADARAPSAAR